MNIIEKNSELDELVSTYNSKNYTRMIKRRSHLLDFLKTYACDNGFPEVTSIPEMLWCYVKNTTPVKCVCNENAKFNTFNKGYRPTCGSSECRGITQGKSLSKFWKDNPESLSDMIKTKENTLFKEHGVTNPMDIPESAAKQEATMMREYGVRYPLQSKEVRAKGENTSISKYGGLMTQARAALHDIFIDGNPFNHKHIQDKARNTINENKGVFHPKQHYTELQKSTLFNEDLFREFINGKSYFESAFELGVDRSTIGRYCGKYNCDELIDKKMSRLEVLVRMVLDQYHIRYEMNNRTILAEGRSKQELDFYIPDHNLAIEVGALYTHNELRMGRGRNYHSRKSQKCQEQGITLYQWFDDEIDNSFEVIINKILYSTGMISYRLGARRCEIIESTDYQVEAEFLNTNHIQGESTNRTKTFLRCMMGILLV